MKPAGLGEFVEFDADCMTEHKPGKRWRREIEERAREYLQDAGFPLATAEILLDRGGPAYIEGGEWFAFDHRTSWRKAWHAVVTRDAEYVTVRRRMVEQARKERIRHGWKSRLP